MSELTHALTDIARSGSLLDSLKAPAGPNNWDEVMTADFGPEYDFEITNFGSTSLLYPISRAALQWCYRFLPEDCPRTGCLGFIIENNWIDLVVRQAQGDNLMTPQDYANAMEELNQLDTQWEGQ